jgi:hypothetical protein
MSRESRRLGQSRMADSCATMRSPSRLASCEIAHSDGWLAFKPLIISGKCDARLAARIASESVNLCLASTIHDPPRTLLSRSLNWGLVSPIGEPDSAQIHATPPIIQPTTAIRPLCISTAKNPQTIHTPNDDTHPRTGLIRCAKVCGLPREPCPELVVPAALVIMPENRRAQSVPERRPSIRRGACQDINAKPP